MTTPTTPTGPGRGTPTPAPDPDDPTTPGYELAVAELDRIVAALQRDDVGVDELAEQVARGAWLVEVCRARLHRAELAVSDVVEALRAQEGADPTDAGGR